MSQTPPPTKPPAESAPTGPQWSDAEKQADTRLRELKDRCTALESEIRITEGRTRLSSPALVQSARTDTERLRKRLRTLTQAFWLALRDAQSPRDSDAAKIRSESLRQNSVDFFGKLNLNADLWKNIAS
jgi:hypothetical protein